MFQPPKVILPALNEHISVVFLNIIYYHWQLFINFILFCTNDGLQVKTHMLNIKKLVSSDGINYLKSHFTQQTF